MPECLSRRVEGHGQMGGLLLFRQFKDVFCESEENGHVRSFGINHGMPHEGIVHLEYQGVSVYQKESFLHVGCC